MVRVGAGSPLAQGQIIWSMDWLHLCDTKLPSRRALKFIQFPCCRTAERNSLALKHGAVPLPGRSCEIGNAVFLSRESVLRCISLPCPQKNQLLLWVRCPGAPLLLVRGHGHLGWVCEGEIPGPSRRAVISQQLTTSCRKLELPIS